LSICDYALEAKELNDQYKRKLKELEAEANSVETDHTAQKNKLKKGIKQLVIKKGACLVRPKLCLKIAKCGLHLLQKKLRLGKIDEDDSSKMNAMCIYKMKACLGVGDTDTDDRDDVEMQNLFATAGYIWHSRQVTSGIAGRLQSVRLGSGWHDRFGARKTAK